MSNVHQFPKFTVLTNEDDLSQYQIDALQALDDARRMILSGRSRTLVMGQVLTDADNTVGFAHSFSGGLADAITITSMLSGHAYRRWSDEAESYDVGDGTNPMNEEDEPDA